MAFTKLPQRFPGLRPAFPERELNWRPGLLLRDLHNLSVRTGTSSG